MTYNSQGQFLVKQTWSDISHREFVNALLENDAERVGLACREIMRNAVCFIREIDATSDKIPDPCLELDYNTCFINAIYSLDRVKIDKKRIKNLESLINLDTLARYFAKYIYFCRRRQSGGQEYEIALKLLAKLAEYLRCEAMSLTSSHYRSFRCFLESPINSSILSGVGTEIEDCINHINNSIRKEPGTVLPLDPIPCDVILSKIATNFGIYFPVAAKNRSKSL